MTQSLARILAFPFAIILIFAFTYSEFDFAGPMTLVVLGCLILLALLYVFHNQIDEWWWKQRPPKLDPPVKRWMDRFSPYYRQLPEQQKIPFESTMSIFIKTKEYTLKAEKDYQLEEDIKGVIAHEFMRVGLHVPETSYPKLDHIVVYNHPFGTPNIQTLHSAELNREDGVIILSRELVVNGFIQPSTYVNISLLTAVMTFIWHHPRLDYPPVKDLSPEEIAEAHKVDLQVILQTLGVDHINKLDLLIFCFFMYPERTKEMNDEVYEKLLKLFGNGIIRPQVDRLQH